jgi:hypothetical protein
MHFLFEGRILKEDAMSAPIGPDVHGKLGEVTSGKSRKYVRDKLGSNYSIHIIFRIFLEIRMHYEFDFWVHISKVEFPK